MSTADLVPLFAAAAGGGKGVGFRQGSVVSWNQETAENVILIGDGLFTNLPCLNTSEASLLNPGDVVGVLTSGSSWAILGRLIIPGSPEAASSIKAITNRIVAAADASDGYRTSNTWGDLTGTGVGPSVTVRVGASGRALCLWSCELGQTVSGGFLQYQKRNTPHVGVQVSGASTVAPSDFNALNYQIEHPAAGSAGDATTQSWIQAAMMHLFTGLNPGDTTFTLKYRNDTISPAGESHFNAREIAVFVL